MKDLRKAAERVLKNYDEAPFTVQVDFFWQEDFEALRQVLAQPIKSYCGGKPNYCTEPEDWVKQKPVAWMDKKSNTVSLTFNCYYNVPLYTAPPKREWVGLTDEEIKECCEAWYWKCAEYKSFEDFLRSVEAKLKEKNGG